MNRKTKSIFGNQPEQNRLKGRSRNRGWNFVNADLKKCKIFNWKKWSKDRQRWKAKSLIEEVVKIPIIFYGSESWVSKIS